MSSNAFSLLVIVGEPLSEDQPLAIFQRIIDGLSAWNSEKAPINLNMELLNFINKDVKPEILESGGVVLRSSVTRLDVEFLVGATVQSLQSSLQHFLTSAATYKQIIFAGPTFSSTGSWILRDGTFSMHDFARTLHQVDVATAFLQVAPNSTLVVSCFPEGEWTDQGAKHHGLDKYGQIVIGIPGGNELGHELGGKRIWWDTDLDSACVSALQSYLERFVKYVGLTTLMPTSSVVGSIRFRRPTIYIFPAGQGDGALFGVAGFLMLLDGGFQRKTCFWDFLRHVDHLDAVLISCINQGNVFGTVSFLDLLATTGCAPKLAHAFGNVPEIGKNAAVGQEIKNPLLVSLYDEGAKIFDRLSRLGLKSQVCAFVPPPVTAKVPESMTLYEKVGQGRLEMFVLNPAKESKEFAEFVETWKKRAPKLLSNKFSTKPDVESNDFPLPLVNRSSLAVLIIWRPSDQNERIVRVLYPGSCPQEKILSAMERLKSLDVLKYPYCTASLLEKRPPGGLATTKAALLAKKPSAGKTAAELMAEGLVLSSAIKPAVLSATAAKQARGATPATPSPLSPGQLQSPPLDSEELNGTSTSYRNGGVKDEDGNNSGLASPANFGRNFRPGLNVEADSGAASAYEQIGGTVDDSSKSNASENQSLENRSDGVARGDDVELEAEAKKSVASRSSSLNPEAQPFFPKSSPSSADSSPDSVRAIGTPETKGADGAHADRLDVDEVMKEWGEPMALPTLANKKEPTPSTTKPSGPAKPSATVPKPAATRPSLQKTTGVDNTKKGPNLDNLKKGVDGPKKVPAVENLKKTSNGKSAMASSVKTSSTPTAASAKTAVRKIPASVPTTTGVGSRAPTGAKLNTTVVKKPSNAVAYSSYYVDLTYVPHQGNPYYANVDFFKYIRSKYYVFSNPNPPKETLDALLAGKKFWAMPDESITIIPTYDNDTMALWMALHKDELALENVDVAPSCARCSVNLEEHTGATCAAYRLEL